MYKYSQVIYSTPATRFVAVNKKAAIVQYIKTNCRLCIEQTGEMPTTEDINESCETEEFIDNFGEDALNENFCDLEELLYLLFK